MVQDNFQEEPDFMKYIKNLNINYVNNEYLKDHFAEEEEDVAAGL